MLSRRLAIAGVIVGLTVLAPTAGAGAGSPVYPPNQCQLTLSLGVAVAGQTVIASTADCTPGYQTGATVQIDLLSDPVFLTNVAANSVGNFSTEITIPEGTALGLHQVRSTGPSAADGSPLVLFADIEIVAPGAGGGGQLAFTGSDSLPWVWIALALLAGGTALVIGARRRAQVHQNNAR